MKKVTTRTPTRAQAVSPDSHHHTHLSYNSHQAFNCFLGPPSASLDAQLLDPPRLNSARARPWLTEKLSCIRDGALPTNELMYDLIKELERHTVSQKSVMRALDKRGLANFFRSLRSNSLYTRKLALKALLQLAHCNYEVQASLLESAANFTPVSGLVSLTGLPPCVRTDLVSQLPLLREKAAHAAHFLQELKHRLSPAKPPGAPSSSSSQHHQDSPTTRADPAFEAEVPLCWQFPDPAPKSETPPLPLDTSFGESSEPEAAGGSGVVTRKAKQQHQMIMESTGCSPLESSQQLKPKELLDDEILFYVDGPLSRNSVVVQQRSKCVSFAQSSEDLYNFQLTELEDIPDPATHLVGFYHIPCPFTPSTPIKTGSPELRGGKATVASSATTFIPPRPLSSLGVKRTTQIPMAGARRSRQEAQKVPAGAAGRAQKEQEELAEKKSRESLLTTSDASGSVKSVKVLESKKPSVGGGGRTASQSQSKERAGLASASLMRKSMVVGRLKSPPAAHTQQRDLSLSQPRKSTQHKSSRLHTRHQTMFSQHRPNLTKDVQKQQQGHAADKVLLHHSINNSQEINQTIDLSQNTSLIAGGDETPHRSRAAVFPASPKGAGSFEDCCAKPAFLQTQPLAELSQAIAELKEEGLQTARAEQYQTEKLSGGVGGGGAGGGVGGLEGVQEEAASPTRSPKKNFVKMNIEKMKNTRSLLKPQKRNARERYTSLVAERDFPWQSEARRNSIRQISKPRVSDSFASTLRGSSQRKSMIAESQLSVAVKNVTAKSLAIDQDSCCSGLGTTTLGPLTPIGEKCGAGVNKPAGEGGARSSFVSQQQAPAQKGFSHFTLKRGARAETRGQQRSVERSESIRQSLKFTSSKRGAAAAGASASVEMAMDYASSQSCKRSSIYAKKSFLPSRKHADSQEMVMDLSAQDMKKMLFTLDSRKVTKRNSGIPRVSTLMQTRHSIAIPPKHLATQADARFLQDNDSVDSVKSDLLEEREERKQPVQVAEAGARAGGEGRAGGGGGGFRRKPEVSEMKGPRGQSSPTKCQRRAREEQENEAALLAPPAAVQQKAPPTPRAEEKPAAAAATPRAQEKNVLKESPQRNLGGGEKSGAQQQRKALGGGGEHSRRLSGGSKAFVTPRQGKSLKLKTPTSIRKPGWAK